MSVICFSSLKGGVGKTSLSVNVAHAFSKRGCKTLLIDFDPCGHATALLFSQRGVANASLESPLARLLFSKNPKFQAGKERRADKLLSMGQEELVLEVRPNLELLAAGKELRHLLWGKGAKALALFFPALVRELGQEFDQIIIDTPPDFNALTRNAIANANLVVVPVDASAMSINSLEELVSAAQHIKGPTWAIVRTMLSRKASHLNMLAEGRLQASVAVESLDATLNEEDFPELPAIGIEDSESFVNLLREHEEKTGQTKSSGSNEPIYLLHSITYRTEEQNRLTFNHKTAFDTRRTNKLAGQYLDVAKELEEILALSWYDDQLDVSQMSFAEQLSP